MRWIHLRGEANSLLSLKQRCSLRDWTAGRLVTAFAEAIVPDVGNYLQIDDRHLLLEKLSSSLASLIWRGERGKEEWPFLVPHGEALTKSDQEDKFSLPDGLSLPKSVPNRFLVPKTQERFTRCWREDGEIEAESNSGRRTKLYAISSLSRLLLLTVSQTLQEILNLKHGYGH